ncbi:20714_t:CDS:1, partial [Rhizophagus irregularis]
QVNSNVWNKAQPAIYKKVEYEMTSYSRLEKNHVSQLEIALSNVHLKLEEYELLMLMKHKATANFTVTDLKRKQRGTKKTK